MKAERDKLKRLQRLERVRAIAKQTLATEAARAEGTYAQLNQLAVRTGQLAADYAARTDIADGADLRGMNRFAAGLQGIRAATQADADRAQTIADRRQQELAMAERRRAAVEDRVAAQTRQIAARQSYAALAGQIQAAKRRNPTD